MALVVLLETGRQPIDNPDTHLELTMIHEGPLLEYAGRDLALLQWAAAARHWVVLVLAAGLFLPHPRRLRPAASAALAVGVAALVRGARRRRDLAGQDAPAAGARRLLAGDRAWRCVGVVSWVARRRRVSDVA